MPNTAALDMHLHPDRRLAFLIVSAVLASSAVIPLGAERTGILQKGLQLSTKPLSREEEVEDISAASQTIHLRGRDTEDEASLPSADRSMLQNEHLYSTDMQQDHQEVTRRAFTALGDELSAVVSGATGRIDHMQAVQPSDRIGSSVSPPDPTALASSKKPKLPPRQSRFELGIAALTERDRKDLSSKQKLLERVQGRVNSRIIELEQVKPEPWDVQAMSRWQQHMAAESAARAEVLRVLEEIRRASHAARSDAGLITRNYPAVRRSPAFVGLTNDDIELFKSLEHTNWMKLRKRLRQRTQTIDIQALASKYSTGKEDLRAGLRADQAWLSLMDFLTPQAGHYKVEYVSAALAAIAGLSPTEAARRAPAIVTQVKAEAEADLNRAARRAMVSAVGKSHATRQREGQAAVTNAR